MSEKSRLTDEELEFILGDQPTKTKTQDSSGFDTFKAMIENSTSQIAQAYASKIGEEIEVTVESVEQVMEASIDEDSPPYYVATGTFTNNGDIASYLVYPTDLSKEIVQKSTGVEEIDDSAEQISEPLKELAEAHLTALAEHFKERFVGIVDSVSKLETLDSISNDNGIVKISYLIGSGRIYHFLNAAILSFFAKETTTANSEAVLSNSDQTLDQIDTASQTGATGGSQTLEDSLLGISNEAPAAAAKKSDDFSSFFSTTSSKDTAPVQNSDADLDPFANLSESLGKPAGQAARVEFADLGGQSTKREKSPIDFLMDVSMEVAVELGRTKKRVNEILELGRGAIIELNKLAGEPLDIMVNQKLIAKGEVVVIDEHFGIRVVEIISQNEREHSVS